MNHQVELRRDSTASCTSPSRSRLRFRRRSLRRLRRFRCLRFERGIAMLAGTADSDAEMESYLELINKNQIVGS